MSDEQIEFFNAIKDIKDCRLDILMSKINSEIDIDNYKYSKLEELIKDSVLML